MEISVKDHGDVNASYAVHESKWIPMLMTKHLKLVENFTQKLTNTKHWKVHCCTDWDSQTLFYNSLANAEW